MDLNGWLKLPNLSFKEKKKTKISVLQRVEAVGILMTQTMGRILMALSNTKTTIV